MTTFDHGPSSPIQLSSPDDAVVADNQDSRELASQALKPVDRGRDAWTVLLSGFVFDALFWGFPMSFGVFQNYYSNLPEMQAQSSRIPLIGTTAQGLYYLGSPISAYLTKRFPRYQKLQIWAGWPLCILGLLSASFATSVDGLMATQGLLYGLGFVILTYPILSMINEWWVARKGMAFGLISASSGATGIVMPFIIESLLANYGHRTTLRASAVAMALLTAPLLPLFKGRLPAPAHSTRVRTDWAFLKQSIFWIYASSILIQGLGFFFPLLFLPSYAASIGLPATQGALLLALLCLAQVLGQFALGYLSDKNVSASLLAATCCVAAALSSYTLWGLSKSMAPLIVFALIYGFSAFGFGTLRVAMGRAVNSDPSAVFATYAIFVFLQGIGNVLVGPISSPLLSGATVRERYGSGKYGAMVVFTGASSFLAALVIAAWHGYRGVRNLIQF